jgi:hypothetical protein
MFPPFYGMEERGWPWPLEYSRRQMLKQQPGDTSKY